MKLAALVAFVPKLQFFRNNSLTLVRTQVVVGDDGIGHPTQAAMQFSGAVDPSQSDELTRMLEGQHLSGSIMVTTDAPVSAGNATQAADEILWNGRRYQVVSVADYAEGGVGLRSAACTLVDINPAA